MFRVRIARSGGAAGLARRAAISSYLVPTSTDLVKVPDISGNGLHAPYDGLQPNAGQFSALPPAITPTGSIGQATTPIFAANFPASVTMTLFAKTSNNAGSYRAGLTLAYMFMRVVWNDIRAYVIATDNSGNFLISPNALPLDTWHDFTIVGKPGLSVFYVDGLPVAQVAKGPRADANPRWRFDYSDAGAYGVALLYLGTALTADEVKQNNSYLRAQHHYPAP